MIQDILLLLFWSIVIFYAFAVIFFLLPMAIVAPFLWLKDHFPKIPTRLRRMLNKHA